MYSRQIINHCSTKGFTLIELLISISVFAVISVMAYGGLSQIIDNSLHSKAQLERLQTVQRAILTLGRDLTQISHRAIRDEYGNIQPALLTGSNLDHLVEFTRSGRRNPAKLKRSNLLRVAYQQRDDQLIRLFWPQLDRAQGSEPYENVLIEQVAEFELRYMDEAKKWHPEWPPTGSNQQNNAPAQLIAIELTLDLKDWGEIKRLYQVGG